MTDSIWHDVIHYAIIPNAPGFILALAYFLLTRRR